MKGLGLLLLYLVDYGIYWRIMEAICEPKRRADWLAAAVTVGLAGFSAVNCFSGAEMLFSNLMALVVAIFLGIFCTRYFQVKIRQGIGICICYSSILYLIDFAGVLILGILLRKPEISDYILDDYGIWRHLYYGILRTIEAGICLKLTKKKNPDICRTISQRTGMLYLLAVVLFWSMSQILMVRVRGATVSLLLDKSLWVVFAAALMTVYILYQMYLQLKSKETEQKLKLQLLKENLRQMEAEQNSRARVIHDVRHQIHAIQVLMAENQMEEAKEYLTKIIGQIKRESVEQWCENSTANAILNRKVAEARERGIRVETDIDAFPCRIDEMDLCVIFANLMENAIEAAAGVPDPWIGIVIKMERGQVKICIRNCFSQAPVEEDGELKTTKPEKERHGFGLLNVKEIVEKNRGMFLYTYDEIQFEVLIVL